MFNSEIEAPISVGETATVNADEARESRESRKLRKLLKKQLRKQMKEAGANHDAEESKAKKFKVTETADSEEAVSEIADLEVHFTKENVAATSTYISLCMQLAVLEEQKQVLTPFVSPRIIELMARRMKKFRVQALGPPKKKRLTAYLVFFREAKKVSPLLSMKEAGAKWKELDNEKKLEFTRMAEQENAVA